MTRLEQGAKMAKKSHWNLLVCPQTGGHLTHRADKHELWCRASALAYPIRGGVAVMLVEEARPLTQEERGMIQ